ncbi:MAG: protein kinase [Planctomycetota bacterium]|nr:protein kinase [Planctomycetota bacterium]MDA1136989.1 protein kinase [Planctomycetota bacterium]
MAEKTPVAQLKEMIGRTIGGCKITDFLGQGAMGDVFRAQQHSLKRVVAIKFLGREFSRRHDLIQRFEREAHAVARLNHQNVAQVYDFGESNDGLHYLVMEYVDGGSLEDIAQKEWRIEPDRALNYMSQAAAGTANAQEAGILHRDIKPGNLLVSQSGIVKVVDFGLAKTNYESSSGDLTWSGSMMGTPNYMSPEQCSGGKVDEASDVYCLGGTFYRLVTGRMCFPADNAVAVMMKHQSEDPLPPFLLRPELPAGYSEVIMKSLAKRPEDRYGNAAAFYEDLQRLGNGQPALASSFSYYAPPVDPGFLDDQHVLRGVMQWGIVPNAQLKEAIQIQAQLKGIDRQERIHEILVAKDWIKPHQMVELLKAIHRSRRQTVDSAFVNALSEMGTLPAERIEWLQRKLKELEISGKPDAAWHQLEGREYLYPDETRTVLLTHLDKERTKEEAAFIEAATGLGFVKLKNAESIFAAQRNQRLPREYRRPEQLALENRLVAPEQVDQIFRARLFALLGGKSAGSGVSTPKPFVANDEDIPASKPVGQSGILPDLDKIEMESGYFCPFCRKEIARASVYCPFCRHSLSQPMKRKAANTPAQPTAPSSPRTQPTPGQPNTMTPVTGPAPVRRSPSPPGAASKSPAAVAGRYRAVSTPTPKTLTTVPDLWVARMPAGELTRPLNLELVAQLIAVQKIRRETAIQPPYTDGEWVPAGRVKQLSRFFGVCHQCDKRVLANDVVCPNCKVDF